MTGLPLNINIQQILLHLLNFSILAVGLYILLYKPVVDFMKKREEYYASLDKEAKERLEKADSVKAAYEEKLAQSDAEIEERKMAAHAALSKEHEARIRESKAEADQILEDARKRAAGERERLMSDAQEEIAVLAQEAARKIVMDSLSDAYDEFLDSAERGQADE